MAQKFYCDICGGEVNVTKTGNSSYIFVKWERFGKQNAQPKRIEEIYCENCTSRLQGEIGKYKIEEKNKK